jgi:hypothetical protein
MCVGGYARQKYQKKLWMLVYFLIFTKTPKINLKTYKKRDIKKYFIIFLGLKAEKQKSTTANNF